MWINCELFPSKADPQHPQLVNTNQFSLIRIKQTGLMFRIVGATVVLQEDGNLGDVVFELTQSYTDYDEILATYEKLCKALKRGDSYCDLDSDLP